MALAAFSGSLADTLSLQKDILGEDSFDSKQFADNVLAKFNQVFNGNFSTTDLSIKTQHVLTSHVHKKTLAHLETQGSARTKAIVKACSVDGSALWTNVFPRFGCRFTSEEFRCALCYRLGIPLLASGGETCLECGGVTDEFGAHISTCKALHPSHHNAIRDLLRAQADRASLRPAHNEPKGLLAMFGRDNDRPADVFIPNFLHGKDTCIDVSIVCSFTDIAKAALTAGHNITRAEEVKRDKYEAGLDRLQLAFIPFVMESMGGFGGGCNLVLHKIGRALADVERVSPEIATHRLKQLVQCKWMQMIGSSLAAQFASRNNRVNVSQPE